MVERHRLAGLDALRGFAAMAVVLYHYTTWYAEEMGGHGGSGISFTFPQGHFGVELFFILSGFVIFLTLDRHPTLGAFIRARLLRLYPAFLACLLVAVLADPGAVSAAQLAANLTMAPELLGARAIDGSYWSLAYELVFYALAALCVIRLGWRAPELPCAGWLLVALALRLSDWDVEHRWLERVTAAWFAHLFVIGIMLFRIHAGQAGRMTWLVLAVAVEIAFLGPHWAAQPIAPWAYGLMITGFAGLVALAASPVGDALAIAPLRFLGTISYPLYLVHQTPGFILIARLEDAGLDAHAAIGIAVGASILAAWLVTRWVEAPLRARLASLAASNWITLVPGLVNNGRPTATAPGPSTP